MKALVFSTHDYDREALIAANESGGHELIFQAARLDHATAALADGYEAVIPFVNDRLDAPTIERLASGGVRLIALRCAGYNNVDLAAADRLRLAVANVPGYTPRAVAEHVFALLLSIMRHTPRAYNRVHEGNFSLEGLVGRGLFGHNFGIVGLGRIGLAVAAIARGFGCRLLAYDPVAKGEPDIELVSLDKLVSEADFISLHAPLLPRTRHMIGARELALMGPRTILINTSRGGLIDTPALVDALRAGRLGGVGLDVYEEEEGVFYTDLSDLVLTDDVLARLLTFRNVLITSHMGFLTREALAEIAASTLANLSAFAAGRPLPSQVHAR